jgi:GTP-binding protein
MTLFVLVDSRLKPQKIDIEFMTWLGEMKIPFVICFTKLDKLSKTIAQKNIDIYKKEMLNRWEELPQMFYTSSVKEMGQKEILSYIGQTNTLFQ